jgi:hypothetical protein
MTFYVLEGGNCSDHIFNLFGYDFSFPSHWMCDSDSRGFCIECSGLVSENSHRDIVCSEKKTVQEQYEYLMENNSENLPFKINPAVYFQHIHSSNKYLLTGRTDARLMSEARLPNHDLEFPLMKWLYHQENNMEFEHSLKKIKKYGMSGKILEIHSTIDLINVYNEFMSAMLAFYVDGYKKILNQECVLHYQSVEKLSKELLTLQENCKKYKYVPENKLCVICQKEERKYASSCGHYVYCYECISKLSKCAVCREELGGQSPTRIYE